MISICARTFDPRGARIFRHLDPATSNASGHRRVTRTATLDGGASVHDTGYSVSDRKILVTDLRPDAESVAWVDRMTRLYGKVRISTGDGVFVAVPESWSLESRGLRLSLLIVEELTWPRL